MILVRPEWTSCNLLSVSSGEQNLVQVDSRTPRLGTRIMKISSEVSGSHTNKAFGQCRAYPAIQSQKSLLQELNRIKWNNANKVPGS